MILSNLPICNNNYIIIKVITIEDKTYTAEGYEVVGPGETLFFSQ